MNLVEDFAALNEREHLTEKYPLYSQDGKRGDTLVIAKYFFTASAATWYVTEASEEEGDITFFGLVTGLVEDELGYFTLSQLEEVKLEAPVVFVDANTGKETPGTLPASIERDLYFTPKPLSECAPDFCAWLWGDKDAEKEGKPAQE